MPTLPTVSFTFTLVLESFARTIVLFLIQDDNQYPQRDGGYPAFDVVDKYLSIFSSAQSLYLDLSYYIMFQTTNDDDE